MVVTGNDLGPDEIVLSANEGSVAFSHHFHQNLTGCKGCHIDGPAQGKILRSTRASNKDLPAKEAFHRLCKDCHKQQTGPTKCRGCHTKS
ncbi:MAG: cytochrome c3 family protein [bacterium]|nr:cytochrome c3 family protein [bacterium]